MASDQNEIRDMNIIPVEQPDPALFIVSLQQSRPDYSFEDQVLSESRPDYSFEDPVLTQSRPDYSFEDPVLVQSRPDYSFEDQVQSFPVYYSQRPEHLLHKRYKDATSSENPEMEGKPQPNEDLKLAKWIEMLNQVLPPETCEVKKQCIYKVPPRIRQAQSQVYTPQIISIGPFHNPCGHRANEATKIFWSMEALKLKYLKGFLNRTELPVGDLLSRLKGMEDNIRNCYAGGAVIDNSDDFLMIIITDACFIIELFLRSYDQNSKENDPILSKPWLFNHIVLDMILLENQLPFSVLQDIYGYARLNSKFPSFIEITTRFFRKFNEHNIDTKKLSPEHFVDLLRIFLIKPLSFDLEQKEQEANPIRCCSQCTGDLKLNFCLPKNKEEQETNRIDHVFSASQFWEAGLKFKLSKDSKCLLDLKFDDNKGVLKMPCFRVHDDTEVVFGNILAYEECHFPKAGYINQYMKILDFLINTEKDVSILIENGIIVNLMGDASSVATVITNINKNVVMQDLNPNYLSLCRRLNAFYKNPLNKNKAIFIHEYFNTPWKKASTSAAAMLLLLTLTQTICSVWSLAKQ